MSVQITVEQSPLTITPSNGEHIWNFSSTGYTLTNFKFIIDIYFRPSSVNFSSTGLTPTTRLKVRPNSYGKSIVDLTDIVRTYLNTNTRFSGTTYPSLNPVAPENSVITLSNATSTRTLNAYNLSGGSLNPDLPVLWHAEQYQVIIGAEYEDGGTIVFDIDPEASFQPSPINIFPGVDNKLIPSPYLSGATLGTGYTGSANFFQEPYQSWYYYDLFRYKYESGPDTTCGPREFLNAAGRDYKTISQGGFSSSRVRRRMHHPDCPIIMSFLDGQNDYFNNQTQALVVRGADTQSSSYTYSAYTSNSSTIVNNWDIWKMGVFYLPYNVTTSGTNIIPQTAEKVCFYLSPNSSALDFSARTSEIMEFYLQPYDCVNEPVHLLFLNGRGMWDTYTFGKKSTKTYEVERRSYRQESSLNKQRYSRGSADRGTTIYDQLGDYSVQCSSWFMDENDVDIVEELFFSPEVYIIEGTTTKVDCVPDINDCGSTDVRLYEHLIPVTIQEKSIQRYQKQYQKIFQYTFTLNYASQKRYRTQG